MILLNRTSSSYGNTQRVCRDAWISISRKTRAETDIWRTDEALLKTGSLGQIFAKAK